jgi:hypothetical protein
LNRDILDACLKKSFLPAFGKYIVVVLRGFSKRVLKVFSLVVKGSELIGTHDATMEGLAKNAVWGHPSV